MRATGHAEFLANMGVVTDIGLPMPRTFVRDRVQRFSHRAAPAADPLPLVRPTSMHRSVFS
jgi:hypothetical protein